MIKKYFPETWNGLGGVLIFFPAEYGRDDDQEFLQGSNFFQGLKTPKRTPKHTKTIRRVPKDSFLKSRWQAAQAYANRVE